MATVAQIVRLAKAMGIKRRPLNAGFVDPPAAPLPVPPPLSEMPIKYVNSRHGVILTPESVSTERPKREGEP